MPFLLRYENVADYRDGEVWILDRRAYPLKEEVVRCTDYREVAKAIADMVTQSGGPWLAAALGMVSAAKGVRSLSAEKAKEELENTARSANSRPSHHVRKHESPYSTNSQSSQGCHRPRGGCRSCHNPFVQKNLEDRYRNSRQMAMYTVDLLPDNVTILTQCYAETLIGFILFILRKEARGYT